MLSLLPLFFGFSVKNKTQLLLPLWKSYKYIHRRRCACTPIWTLMSLPILWNTKLFLMNIKSNAFTPKLLFLTLWI